MGRYPQGEDHLLEELSEALRLAGFFVMTTDDVMPYNWLFPVQDELGPSFAYDKFIS